MYKALTAIRKLALSWVCPNGHANLDSSPFCNRCR
jgi:hypothetical protein